MKRFTIGLTMLIAVQILHGQAQVVPTVPRGSATAPSSQNSQTTSPASPLTNSLTNALSKQATKDLANPDSTNPPSTQDQLKTTDQTMQTPVVAEPSQIENLFNRIRPQSLPALVQIGYDATTGLGGAATTQRLSGTNVSPNYTLGFGDQLTLMVWGDPVDLGDLPPLVQLEVNRSGSVFFAPVGLVPAAGAALSDVEKALFSGLARKYKKFDLRLVLSQLRQFPITVTGFVGHPGPVQVTAADGPLEVLQAAGGVSKNGSLRGITLRSRDGKVRTLDLYQILLRGFAAELGLREGDVLHVPAIGTTVAILGAVNRPGIYEAAPGESMGDLYDLGGGGTPDSQPDAIRVSTMIEGRVNVTAGSLSDPGFRGQPLKAGLLLELLSGSLDVTDGVWIEGPIQNPGWFSLPASGKLSELLPKLGPLSGLDPSQAQLVHVDKKTRESSIEGFSLLSVLNGSGEVLLRPEDRVRFFENKLSTEVYVAGEVERPTTIPWRDGLTFDDVLAQVRMKGDPRQLIVQIRSLNQPVKEVFLRDLLSRQRGAPIPIPSGASVRFVPVPANALLDSVQVLGAVARPGAYGLSSEMKLSDVLEQAGGLTAKGSLAGLVFQRTSVLEAQKSQLSSVTKSLDDQITALEAQVAAATDPQTKASAQAQLDTKKAALETIQSGLQASLGRISLNLSDDASRLSSSAQNLFLEPGDRIYVPNRPEFVTVLGAVYNQSTQVFMAGKTVGDALNQAGGVMDSGNVNGAYVIRAGGLVESADKNRLLFFWNGFLGLALLPGDTVVVPSKDPNTVDAWTVTKESIQLLGTTVGLTANSLAIMKTLGVLK